MRLALMSDVHGNMEALDACLADARRRGFDQLAFLGDAVGYGADPGVVVDILSEEVARGAIALIGNHDAAIENDDSDLNDVARAALAWTRPRLSKSQREFLRTRRYTAGIDDVLLVHASAHHPADWEYVRHSHSALRCIEASPARITICGHVHVPSLWRRERAGKVSFHAHAIETPIELSAPHRWAAVIGAVGQPRDGSPSAGYAMLDMERAQLTFLRVAYDHAAAARKIIHAGLPSFLAERLFRGE